MGRRPRPSMLAGAVTVVAALVAASCSSSGSDADGAARVGPVDAGSLSVSVDGSGRPWSLRVAAGDAPILRSIAAGAVELTTPEGPRHSTRILATHRGRGGSVVTKVATEDGGGHRGPDLTVTVRRAADGVVGVRIDARGDADQVTLALAARPGERYLGLGERATGVDHRGEAIENRVLDGPYTEVQTAVVGAVVPKPGFRDRPDATYFPMPWVLSTGGYGVLVDDDDVSRFRLATPEHPDQWRVQVDSSRLDLRVFGGPRPADALARMTRAIGRQPEPAAPFVLGPWWQPDDDEVTELAALVAADVPLSLAQTYTHYLPCGDQQGAREEQRQRTDRMHRSGLAVTTYINPMVCVSNTEVYEPGVAASAFTQRADGSPYRYPYFTNRFFDVVQFDFSGPAGRDLFGSVLDQTVADGYDGWMEDFGEYTPDDARSDDGTPGPTMHNRYVEQYHAAARAYADAAPRPLARFNRSGWTGAVAESQIVWGGDPTTAWDFDGLRSAVSSGLGMGLSGVSTWGSDIGGFFSFSGEQLTPELLNRWIELGALSGVMRLQSGGISVGGGPRAQVLDPDVLPVWRRYAKLRTQLYPYIAGATETYRRTGLPVMRHLALTDPGDRTAVARDDQYLFGADLLAAPVVEPGVTERAVYLPAGDWVDLWRSTSVADDGSLALGAATVRSGRATVSVAAPEHEIPLQVRMGAVLPMLPADVDTLASYGAGTPGVVRLADRQGARTLLAFPGPRWRGPLGPGEELESTVLPGRRWTLTVRADRARTYELQASMAGLGDDFEPCRVRVGEGRIAFAYDRDTRVLTSSVPVGRQGRIVVDACG